MSCWPAVVPLLTTRCLYWWWGGARALVGLGGGVKGCQESAGGVGAVRGHWEVAGGLSPTTLGSSPGSQHSHWQGCRRHQQANLGVRGALGTSRECRGSGASRGLGYQGHWGQQGCKDHQGIGGWQWVREVVEGVGGMRVTGGLEAKPHWAPVQGPSTPTGRGVGHVRDALRT